MGGFVEPEVFREKYLSKKPVVFRGAATRENGWDLQCLTGGGDPMTALAEDMDGRKVRVFTDEYEDGSATFMTIEEYAALSETIAMNRSRPMPYARSFPLANLNRCRGTIPPLAKFAKYRSIGAMSMPNEDDHSMVFLSALEGTTTKMHIDMSDSFFTQVYG